jgi:hypothetical protein
VSTGREAAGERKGTTIIGRAAKNTISQPAIAPASSQSTGTEVPRRQTGNQRSTKTRQPAAAKDNAEARVSTGKKSDAPTAKSRALTEDSGNDEEKDDTKTPESSDSELQPGRRRGPARIRRCSATSSGRQGDRLLTLDSKTPGRKREERDPRPNVLEDPEETTDEGSAEEEEEAERDPSERCDSEDDAAPPGRSTSESKARIQQLLIGSTTSYRRHALPG